MSTRQIAHKEIKDAIRRRIAHLLFSLFGLTGGLIGYGVRTDVFEPLVSVLGGLAPFVAVAYVGPSLSNKRRNNELATLLSLPVSRQELVVGSYLGKTMILVSAIVCSYVCAACGVFIAEGTVLPLDHLVWMSLFTVLITVVFVGISLGFAIGIESPLLATTCAFFMYLLFAVQVWALVPLLVVYVANGFSSPETVPDWFHIAHQLSPYATLRNVLVPVAGDVAENIFVIEDTDTEVSFSKSVVFAAPLTVVWLTAPLLLGYHRFQKGGL